jgi:uncharacterized DUF497 family protein
MIFEWDEAKSQANVERKRLSFGWAPFLFDGPTAEAPDERRDYGEARIKAVGMIADRCFVCVFTDRGDVRRIISLRRANRKEANGYRAFLEERA